MTAVYYLSGDGQAEKTNAIIEIILKTILCGQNLNQ